MSESNFQNPASIRGLDGKSLVLQAVDIVQLIGQTVSLKKRGRSYTGLCPFHNEKTPSFHVHPDRGFFKCFGCNAAGNAIDFVMKRDRVEFGEALRTLAGQFNVELPKLGSGQKSDTGLRQALLDACSAAAGVFHNNLFGPAGAAAREYLEKRGFTDHTLKKFKIGLAAQGWDGLMRHPAMSKFRPELLLQAGLLKAKDGDESRRYDTFRDRIMFPISDEQGRVIAFGGRVTATNDSPAKYLNSPETPLFLKSKVAYGLDQGRQRIVETKTVAIVEGYTDVVMAHQFGASNVVATLGTAMTEQHISLLRRFADRVVLLFDGDEAGENAVDRALSIFLSQPIEIAIATLPDGQDPDEYLLEHGLEAFDKLLANAEDALTFQWRQLFRQLGASENDLTARTKAIEGFLQRLAVARQGNVDAIRWGALLARVSKFTEIPVEQLNQRLKPKPVSRFVAATPASPDRRPTLQGDAGVAATGNAAPPRLSARYQAERWLLGALLHLPAEWQKVQQLIDCSEFTDKRLCELAAFYWDHQRHEGEPVVEELIAIAPDDRLKSLIIELADEVEMMNNPAATLADAVAYLRQEKVRQEHSKLVTELKSARARNNSTVNTDGRNDDFDVDVLRKLTVAGLNRSKT